jgi:CubicO group peptidase (beta-lactamase class C family)
MARSFLVSFIVSIYGICSAQLYFPPTNSDEWETISPESMDWCDERIEALYELLNDNSSRAFILLKDGKIVLEKYFGNHEQNTPWYWASAGKTLTSFMVGIAQQEGLLDIRDQSSDYLGEGWTNCEPEQESEITIWHQLTMTTGLDDGVTDNTCTEPQCLECLSSTGQRWAYQNAPYTLLDQVIENATGRNLNVYINQKIRGITGVTGNFLPIENNNVYFSNARSMARFGLLILAEGNWGDTEVMTDKEYFEAMIRQSQDWNQSYGYLWWLNGQQSYMLPGLQTTFPGQLFPAAPADMVSGLGLNGQFLNVIPSENMVWLRMGDAPDNNPVPVLLNNQIAEAISNLACDPSSVEESNNPQPSKIILSPNPVDQYLRIEMQQENNFEISQIRILNLFGQPIRTIENNENIFVGDLSSGVYYIHLSSSGAVFTEKFIKL